MDRPVEIYIGTDPPNWPKTAWRASDCFRDAAAITAALRAGMGQADTSPNGVPVPMDFHAVRAGRNDPCPCGSGLKFKKCCIGKRKERKRG